MKEITDIEQIYQKLFKIFKEVNTLCAEPNKLEILIKISEISNLIDEAHKLGLSQRTTTKVIPNQISRDREIGNC